MEIFIVSGMTFFAQYRKECKDGLAPLILSASATSCDNVPSPGGDEFATYYCKSSTGSPIGF
jgi:hypothetical protein